MGNNFIPERLKMTTEQRIAELEFAAKAGQAAGFTKQAERVRFANITVAQFDEDSWADNTRFLLYRCIGTPADTCFFRRG